MGKFLILAAVVLPMFFGCKNVKQNKEMFKSIDVEEFAKLIEDEDVQRLDVRTSDEYEEGHIENALLIDVLQDDYENRALELLDKRRPVALYCRSGNRSKKAAQILASNGYDVYELATGFRGWSAAGKAWSK